MLDGHHRLAFSPYHHWEPLFHGTQRTPHGGPELTLELGTAHQQTMHTAETSTTPPHRAPSGVDTATAHELSLRKRRAMGSKTAPSRSTRQQSSATARPEGIMVFTRRHGAGTERAATAPSRRERHHGRCRRRPQTSWTGFHASKTSQLRPSVDSHR